MCIAAFSFLLLLLLYLEKLLNKETLYISTKNRYITQSDIYIYLPKEITIFKFVFTGYILVS